MEKKQSFTDTDYVISRDDLAKLGIIADILFDVRGNDQYIFVRARIHHK